MTYTAEQLRRDAIAIERMHGETLTVEWRDHQAGLLRAFAAALEENARLTRECEFHAKQCARVDELRHRAEAELAAERERADRNQEDALTLMRALIKVRQQMFPQHDQRAVVSRDFPKLAAIDSARRK